MSFFSLNTSVDRFRENTRSFLKGEQAQAFGAKFESAKKSFIDITSNKRVQVTAASAAGGVAVCGTGGAAVGALVGCVIGGAIGFIPALLTFGLSIPFGAAIGGGFGFVAGGTVAGGAGGVGGGAMGYVLYANKTANNALEQMRVGLMGLVASTTARFRVAYQAVGNVTQKRLGKSSSEKGA